jgi:hypothetical protein
MRLHIKELVDHCRSLGLSVDTGKDFAIVWLGPRMQPRVVRRPPSLHQQQQQQQQQQPGASRAHGAGAHQRRDRRERRRRDARAPFLLVAYRHGAVALLGPPASEPGEEYAMPDEDAAALSRVMPLGAFYRTGRPDGLLHPGEGLWGPRRLHLRGLCQPHARQRQAQLWRGTQSAAWDGCTRGRQTGTMCSGLNGGVPAAAPSVPWRPELGATGGGRRPHDPD